MNRLLEGQWFYFNRNLGPVNTSSKYLRLVWDPHQRTGVQAGIYSSFCLAENWGWDHWILWREFRARFYYLVAACNHRWGIKGQLSPMNLDSLYKLITFLWAILFRVLKRGPIKPSSIWSTNFKSYYYLSKFPQSAMVNDILGNAWLGWPWTSSKYNLLPF